MRYKVTIQGVSRGLFVIIIILNYYSYAALRLAKPVIVAFGAQL